MVVALLASLILQTASPDTAIEFIEVQTAVDAIDGLEGRISEYIYCGDEHEFFRIDCGVVTSSGEELTIFGGSITRSVVRAGRSWTYATPVGSISSGQEFPDTVEMLERFCDHNAVTMRDDSLSLLAWKCRNLPEDALLRIQFDSDYSSVAIEQSIPSP
ncbi:hypothetical protein [uncultured Maricaulis sp.]|uniref:hypothetical protein n=1 Tax=uncultured Maricaulis sp. TaxID=174710 RepID=UPI0030DD73D9|tara:strand:+ start:17053 stop:17529 length:477 start_codon:yes stop_codon:yes gene_type:complete